MQLIETEARRFALKAHGTQLYQGRPFVDRLDAVASIIESYGRDAKILSFLKNVPEDTSVTVADIEARFGSFIARSVGYLSDSQGSDRATRKRLTYARIGAMPARYDIVRVVKAGDRLASVAHASQSGDRKRSEMYAHEHNWFRVAYYAAGQCDDLWSKLDELIARIQR